MKGERMAYPAEWSTLEWDGDPAYNPKKRVYHHQSGMTLREYYAGQFGAMLAASPFLSNEDGIRRAETVAKNAVAYADALIAELEKEENRG